MREEGSRDGGEKKGGVRPGVGGWKRRKKAKKKPSESGSGATEWAEASVLGGMVQ